MTVERGGEHFVRRFEARTGEQTRANVSIYHLYTLACTQQRSTLGPTQASGTRVTCVLTKGLKGRKEEMTPLQWQSTFWSIFLSSSRLHGLILPFFTHFMRLFSFLTVCSCFLKPSFYSVVTIFCNFFFFFFTSLFFFTCYTFFCHKDNLEIHVFIQKVEIKRFPRYFVFLLPAFSFVLLFYFRWYLLNIILIFVQSVFNVNTVLFSRLSFSPIFQNFLRYSLMDMHYFFLLSTSYSLLSFNTSIFLTTCKQ